MIKAVGVFLEESTAFPYLERMKTMSTFQQQLAKAYETLKQAKWVNLSHQIDADSPHFPALPA